jgi:lysine 2,3-aminomutase
MATELRLAQHDEPDWRWQLRHAVTTVDELARRLRLTDAELAGARRAEAQGLPLQITPYYLGLCDPAEASCPIRRQVVPHAAESLAVPGDLADPLGEEAHTVAPHLVQRYPDRVLFVATDQCAIYCRFCTRSRLVGGGDGWAPMEEAMRFVEAHPAVREVIVSGGDPLCAATARIVRLCERIRRIPHVEIIRLATRAPVCLPQRIDAALCEALRPFHPIWLMTHFNHPRELTAEAVRACITLVDAGFPVMNQTVLLRGVNDTAPVLEALFRGLVRARVRPYYLLQMDPVRGSAHLRTPLDRGLELVTALQGRLSGIALPKLVVDTPGGMGKVPLSPDAIVARTPGRTTLRTWRNVTVEYLDPPDALQHRPAAEPMS